MTKIDFLAYIWAQGLNAKFYGIQFSCGFWVITAGWWIGELFWPWGEIGPMPRPHTSATWLKCYSVHEFFPQPAWPGAEQQLRGCPTFVLRQRGADWEIWCLLPHVTQLIYPQAHIPFSQHRLLLMGLHSNLVSSWIVYWKPHLCRLLAVWSDLWHWKHSHAGVSSDSRQPVLYFRTL